MKVNQILDQTESDLQDPIKVSGYGLADAHGIETLVWDPEEAHVAILGLKQRGLLGLRASLNRHRHATYFELHNVNYNDKVVIDRLLKLGKYMSALLYLKGTSEVHIPKEYIGSWDLIPNPEVDPYHHSDDDTEKYNEIDAIELCETN